MKCHKIKVSIKPAQNNTQFNKNDVYGLSKDEIEVDTDVNEDTNRERLLDESLSSFLNLSKRK
jgi:hypothetical protein